MLKNFSTSDMVHLNFKGIDHDNIELGMDIRVILFYGRRCIPVYGHIPVPPLAE